MWAIIGPRQSASPIFNGSPRERQRIPVYENSSQTVSLAALLDELGANPAEVARQLRGSGVQGVRNTARFLNPIVRYLRDRLPADVQTVDLTRGDALSLVFADQSRHDIPLPAAIKKFLDAFNAGKYPDLELPLDEG